MKIPIGPASVAGWLTFAGTEIGFIATAISGSEAQLRGPGKWLAIGGLVSLVATNLGRQLQAALGKGAEPAEIAPTAGTKAEAPPAVAGGQPA